jgi:hypothetical protein
VFHAYIIAGAERRFWPFSDMEIFAVRLEFDVRKRRDKESRDIDINATLTPITYRDELWMAL